MPARRQALPVPALVLAFRNFRVVPPRTGIIHQVNIEWRRSSCQRMMTASSASTPASAPTRTAAGDTGVLGWRQAYRAKTAMLGRSPVFRAAIVGAPSGRSQCHRRWSDHHRHATRRRSDASVLVTAPPSADMDGSSPTDIFPIDGVTLIYNLLEHSREQVAPVSDGCRGGPVPCRPRPPRELDLIFVVAVRHGAARDPVLLSERKDIRRLRHLRQDRRDGRDHRLP